MQKAPLGTDVSVLNPSSMLTKLLFKALSFHWAFKEQKAVDNCGQKALSALCLSNCLFSGCMRRSEAQEKFKLLQAFVLKLL